MKNNFKNIVNTCIRFINNLKRPSKHHNTRLLHKHGQTINSLVIRQGLVEDAPALAVLHVKTWNDTYGGRGPGIQIREHQWRELFRETDRKWFVIVIENKKKELVGFAKGQHYASAELPD